MNDKDVENDGVSPIVSDIAESDSEALPESELTEVSGMIEEAPPESVTNPTLDVEDNNKKAPKRNIFNILWPIFAVLFIIAAAVFAVPFFKYQFAKGDLEKGNYDKAYEAFVDLDGFWNSDELARETLYQKGHALLGDGEFAKAIVAFDKIDDYKDSADMITEARYQRACHYLESGKHDLALASLELVGDYKDSADMITEINYQMACDDLEDKNYELAISAFEDMDDYKDSAEKLNEAKYAYVLKYKDYPNTSAYEYLYSLKKIGYKDSAELYDELFAWKMTVIGWSTGEDNTHFMKTISRYSKAYCHIKLSGGPPDGTTPIRYSGTVPDGRTFEGVLSSEWKNGSKGWVYWKYPFINMGPIEINFYDGDNNLIGSGSVNIGD